jgi:hypothetical protein
MTHLRDKLDHHGSDREALEGLILAPEVDVGLKGQELEEQVKHRRKDRHRQQVPAAPGKRPGKGKRGACVKVSRQWAPSTIPRQRAVRAVSYLMLGWRTYTLVSVISLRTSSMSLVSSPMPFCWLSDSSSTYEGGGDHVALQRSRALITSSSKHSGLRSAGSIATLLGPLVLAP